MDSVGGTSWALGRARAMAANKFAEKKLPEFGFSN